MPEEQAINFRNTDYKGGKGYLTFWRNFEAEEEGVISGLWQHHPGRWTRIQNLLGDRKPLQHPKANIDLCSKIMDKFSVGYIITTWNRLYQSSQIIGKVVSWVEERFTAGYPQVYLQLQYLLLGSRIVRLPRNYTFIAIDSAAVKGRSKGLTVICRRTN